MSSLTRSEWDVTEEHLKLCGRLNIQVGLSGSIPTVIWWRDKEVLAAAAEHRKSEEWLAEAEKDRPKIADRRWVELKRDLYVAEELFQKLCFDSTLSDDRQQFLAEMIKEYQQSVWYELIRICAFSPGILGRMTTLDSLGSLNNDGPAH